MRLAIRIKYCGLTIEERIAYNIKYELDKKVVEESKKGTVQRDIEHAGGKHIETKERADHLFVTYEVDGEKFNSIISKEDGHKVITAGICLTDYNSGESGDTRFDLKSLISVIREGQQTRQINKVL